jgi:hypothetical protein
MRQARRRCVTRFAGIIRIGVIPRVTASLPAGHADIQPRQSAMDGDILYGRLGFGLLAQESWDEACQVLNWKRA